MEDTSIGVLVFAAILALTSLHVHGNINSNLKEGDVRLADGDGVQGRAEIYHNGAWRGICFSSGDAVFGDQHEWELPEADVFCRQLGFTGGAALVLNGDQTAAKYGDPSNGQYLTNVDCATTSSAQDLMECNGVTWGSQCVNNNILGYTGVVCHIPGFLGCYRYDHPGTLLEHEIFSEVMTLDECIDGCLEFNGPALRYVGVRGRDCNCGNTLPSVRDHNHQCHDPCPGDEYQQCGGWEQSRTAIYDLEALEDGHQAPHLIWPAWGSNYPPDDDRIWRIETPSGYDYSVLHLLTFDLDGSDTLILRSEARNSGTYLRGTLDLDLPYRWISNSASWTEVETRVEANSDGDSGFIIFYEFGKHCFASDLPPIEGGGWSRLTGVYYERNCPTAICNPGYAASSNAVCQLDGTWVGNGTCTRVPTTLPNLFKTTVPTTKPTTEPPSTTPSPPTTTTQPLPPTQPRPTTTTQPPQPTTTTKAPTPPVRTMTPHRPLAQCNRPVIDIDTGVFIGVGYKAVFYEGDIITHCCTHKVSDCVELRCLPDATWSMEPYLGRCPEAVCTLPETDENGSIQNPDLKTYFKDGEELGFCCIYSDYCYVLRCWTDGTWENGDELLACPAPRPPQQEKTKIPVWVIIVVVVAGIIGLAIIVICIMVCIRQQQYGYGSRRTHVKRSSPYYVKPRGGYHHHHRKSRRDRSPSPSRKKRHHSPSRRDPVVIGVPVEAIKGITDYAQYGADPIIIGGKHGREAERRAAERQEYERREAERRHHAEHHHHHHHHHPHQHPEEPHHHHSHPDPHHHHHPHPQPPRDDGRREKPRDRDERRRQQQRPRHADEASALGVLNSVVKDLQASKRDSDSGSSSDSD